MLADDLEQVVANERSAYAHPWSFRALMASFSGTDRCWTGTIARQPVAHLIASQVLDEAHLLDLCVGAAWQGKGLGSRMLEFFLAHCREAGIAEVFLEVRAGNVRARGLYARYGFADIGLRKGYYPDAVGREDAIVMRLLLASA